jgi:hypothetical protein
MKTDDGRVTAVLAAPLKLEQMNEIILRRTREHDTDDAFLVNPSNLFVTQPRLISDPAVLQRGNERMTVTVDPMGHIDTRAVAPQPPDQPPHPPPLPCSSS